MTTPSSARGSPLAMFQAHAVAELLQARAGVGCEIVIIRTSGDRLEVRPPRPAASVCSSRDEDALIGGAIDLAVHSSRTCRPSCRGAGWRGASARDARDAWCSRTLGGSRALRQGVLSRPRMQRIRRSHL
jgi:hypothetical protein